jgi:hypothetical protein
MARIRSSRRDAATCVVVTGKLAASDMGRLEHACAPALTDPTSALNIDLRGVTDLDATAKVLLGYMSTRGAHISYPAHLLVTPRNAVEASLVRDPDGA